MHGVKRSAVHLEIADALKTHLLPRLATLSQARLEGLLERTFPYISIDELVSPLNELVASAPFAPTLLGSIMSFSPVKPEKTRLLKPPR